MIECRGRNGWFKYHGFGVFDWKDEATVEIQSKRNPRNCAPILLRGPSDELKRLFGTILEKIDPEASTRTLVRDLWRFIDDVSLEDPTRTDQFFALRERVRNFYEECDRIKEVSHEPMGSDGGSAVGQ